MQVLVAAKEIVPVLNADIGDGWLADPGEQRVARWALVAARLSAMVAWSMRDDEQDEPPAVGRA